MQHTFVQQLQIHLLTAADPVRAEAMSRYMKYHFPFLGIASPIRKDLLKSFLKETKILASDDWRLVIKELWQLPEREYHYCAIEILEKQTKKYQKEDIDLLEWLLLHNAWWDSVDPISTHAVGDYFRLFPDNIGTITERFMESNNRWLQRCCLIFQLFYKEKTDWRLLSDYILVLSESKEFFIQKAIGWSLRQYARTRPQLVADFVANTDLRPLSVREALKHLK